MEREILMAYSGEQGDHSPLQFISSKLLEHYRRCEAELVALKAAGALWSEDQAAPIE